MGETANVVGQAAPGALPQRRHSLLQPRVPRQANGLAKAFRCQPLGKLGEGKGGVRPEEAPQGTLPGPRNARAQNLFSAIGAVDMALAQGAALKITERGEP